MKVQELKEKEKKKQEEARLRLEWEEREKRRRENEIKDIQASLSTHLLKSSPVCT
jgi:urease accessory protein UreE